MQEKRVTVMVAYVHFFDRNWFRGGRNAGFYSNWILQKADCATTGFLQQVDAHDKVKDFDTTRLKLVGEGTRTKTCSTMVGGVALM